MRSCCSKMPGSSYLPGSKLCPPHLVGFFVGGLTIVNINLLKRGQHNGKESTVQVSESQPPKDAGIRRQFQMLLEAAKKGDLGLIEHEQDGKRYATVVVVTVGEPGIEVVPVARIFEG